jgi:hypothetical protein
LNSVNKIFLLPVLFLITGILPEKNLIGQDLSFFKAFRGLSLPEKCWVGTHPFIAKRSYIITQKTLKVTLDVKSSGQLDGDINGGQVDAFKHALWMAALVQEIPWRKARRLGLAHEKGNNIEFRKAARRGEMSSHDLTSIAMDIWNNHRGIDIGLKHPGETIAVLAEKVKRSILKGEMRIIRKDADGRFLDLNHEVINPEVIKGKWDNPKMVVPSDFQFRARL